MGRADEKGMQRDRHHQAHPVFIPPQLLGLVDQPLVELRAGAALG